MSSTVSGMATAAGRWSTARFHARRASSQWLWLGVTNSPVSCSRSVSTDVGVDVEMASLLITFMGAKVWAANHSGVGLPDESGSSAGTTPISDQERFVLRFRVVALRALLAALLAAPVARGVVDLRPVDFRAVGFRAADLRVRLAAPFFADALRFVAARLRVRAPFFAALLRVPAPPMSSRFSIASAAERRSPIPRLPIFSALPCASRPPLSRSERARATRLRMPAERKVEKSSVFRFLAIAGTYRVANSQASPSANGRARKPP